MCLLSICANKKIFAIINFDNNNLAYIVFFNVLCPINY